MMVDPEQRPDDGQPPDSLDERLRREEPPVADDDTSPSRRIDAAQRLAAEEPPLSADDTSPRPISLVADRLRAEEPPITDDDTSPSRPARPAFPVPSARPPAPRGPGRVLWIVASLSAVLLIAVGAGIIINAALSSDTPSGPAPVALRTTPTLSDAAIDTRETATPALEATPATITPVTITPVTEEAETPDGEAAPETGQVTPARTSGSLLLPTAAADAIAAALAAPLPDAPQTRVIRRDAAPFTVRPDNARSEVVPYTVQPGDTLETIASKFGLKDHYTLIWSNSSTRLAELAPGTQINILPEDGVYYEVTEEISIRELAEKYAVDPYVIIDSEYNEALFGSVPDTRLPKGMWVVIPGAEGERFNERIAGSGGFTDGGGGGGLLSGTYSLWGCSADLQGGTEPYSRPLGGYTWMRGFIPGYHDGVDLAGRTDQPVLAAGAGTVVYAGWNNNGYGRVVVIAHSASFSLYGHLNSINVRCGQYVDQGQPVGGMGNTGNSSGTHLHFEVRDTGFSPLNPQNYVGF